MGNLFYLINYFYRNKEEEENQKNVFEETFQNINEIETILNEQKIKDKKRTEKEEKILKKRLNEITVILDESIKIGRNLAKESIKKIENDLEEKININESIKSQEFEKLENELSNKKKEIDLNTENEIKKLKMKIDDALYNKDRKTQ